MTAQRVQFECFHCQRTTMIPVPVEFANWESVASDYCHFLQRIYTEMGQAVTDIELIHGADNPVTQFYRNKWAMIALDMKKHFGMPQKGTSAHARDDGEDLNEGWKHK